MIKKFTLILVLALTINLHGQSALFLLISPSTSFNGMGEIGVGLTSDDLSASYYNPANGFSNAPGLSFSSSGMETPWLPGLVNNLTLSHDQIGLSYKVPDFPVKLNLQTYKTHLDAGEYHVVSAEGEDLGTFEASYWTRSLILAAQLKYDLLGIPVVISGGFARKNVIQNNVDISEYVATPVEVEKIVYDRGLLVDIPLEIKLPQSSTISFRPSFGMSTLNTGDSIVFNEDYGADALPTVVRAGFGLATSFPLTESWDILSYRVGHAALDYLDIPRTTSTESIKYQNGLGDIDLYKHLLKSETDEDVKVSRGHELSLLDFYALRYGRYIDVDGRVNVFESGASYSSKGILNLAYELTRLKFIASINRHLEVRYNYSEWTTHQQTHPLEGTEFKSWMLSFNNLLEVPESLTTLYERGEASHFESLSLLLGLNYSMPDYGSGGGGTGQDVYLSYSIGVEALVDPVVLGFGLTESVHINDFASSIFYTTDLVEIKNVYYQLGFYALYPLNLTQWLGLSAGPQIQSPLLHRKVRLFGETFNDETFKENYGLRASVDVNTGTHFGFRITYSYWHKQMQNLLLDNKPFKPTGLQLEAKISI